MTSGDSISPRQTTVSRTEGESVTLSCSYTASTTNVLLYWYRQNSNRALEYILLKGAGSWSSSSHTADFAKGRFTSTADSSSTTIIISKLALSDTAIYHCALRTNFTRQGNPGASIDVCEGGRRQDCQLYLRVHHHWRYSIPTMVSARHEQRPEIYNPDVQNRERNTNSVKFTSLKITNLRLDDSALYYCALKPTAMQFIQQAYQKPGVISEQLSFTVYHHQCTAVQSTFPYIMYNSNTFKKN
ncbi:Ig heavy chain V region MOPC 21 [Acipenser ruthenus]|uniref:Ig heavy chain V region MOPC 21 n=1 Tax=Acipenser ruthenus TaxID=7906 RepID=A0A444USB7_ACIRT|nr:Ig heavy chain V region MOPC 21 [Acipenser ruthenus]